MSLIAWKSDVEVTYDDKDDEQQALLLMLTRDFSSIEQWSGEVKSKKVVGSTPVTRVFVRKSVQGVNVLIDIGLKDRHFYLRQPADPESIITLSSNGKMNYTADEVTELNLVIKEAYGVYKNVLAKAKKDNK